MKCEWDPRKARSNELKHGVSFDLARSAFDDPEAYIVTDGAHSTVAELRRCLIGESDDGLIVVVFTERSSDVVRIISARRAGRRDRRKYEANS